MEYQELRQLLYLKNNYMDYIFEMQNFEKEILNMDKPTSTILVKQTFTVWYLIVEGCSNLDDNILQSTLNRNINIINKFYSTEVYLLFLKGWMYQISPWFFDEKESSKGDYYLEYAYKKEPDNLLFKWALRESLNINKNELKFIKFSIENDFHKYYIDYRLISEYFKRIIKDS